MARRLVIAKRRGNGLSPNEDQWNGTRFGRWIEAYGDNTTEYVRNIAGDLSHETVDGFGGVTEGNRKRDSEGVAALFIVTLIYGMCGSADRNLDQVERDRL